VISRTRSAADAGLGLRKGTKSSPGVQNESAGCENAVAILAPELVGHVW